MKGLNFAKLFGFFVLALLAVSAASALSMSVSNDLSLSQNATINVLNNDGFDQTVTFSPSSPYTDSSGLIFSFPTGFSLANGVSKSLVINASSVPSDLRFGKYSFTLNANGVNASGQTSSTSVPVSFVKSFCRSGAVGTNLSVTTVDIRSSGTDDTSWMLLDTVTVKVRFENTGDDTVRSIIVELGLFDENGRNRASDLKFTNADENKISYGSLKSGKDDTVTFEFQVPADMSTGNYKLAVKAYSDGANQDKICADSSTDLDNTLYQTISVDSESSKGKFIAFDNVAISPQDPTCGETVTLSADVFNVGDEDQDRVKIDLYNKELGVDASTELLNGLNQGESAPVSFTFTIPNDATATKPYKFGLSSEYDYSSSSDVYRQQSTNTAFYSFNVIGCSSAGTNTGAAGISAALSSEAQAGKPLVVTATITNKLKSAASFVVDASGYESWASLSSISSRMVTLGAGESKDVTLNFDVNSDAAGQKSFNVDVTSGNSQDSRQVVVSLAQASSGFSFSSLGSSSNMIWVIAAINLVLLIVIIIVAVRVSRNR